jgi:hypothetical protein
MVKNNLVRIVVCSISFSSFLQWDVKKLVILEGEELYG